MSRRSRLWWFAALVVSGAGAGYLFTLPESYSFGFFGYGWCPGWEARQEFSRFLAPAMRWMPVVWLGGLPMVVLAFGAHWLSARLGRPRVGRVAARFVAAALLVLYGTGLLAFGVDLALDRESCFFQWAGVPGLRLFAGTDAWPVAAAFCVLAAARMPKHRVRRLLRTRWFRRGAVAAAVTGLLGFLPVSDFAPGPVSAEPCEHRDDIRVSERDFLCGMRRAGRFTAVGDHLALAYGRRQCAAFPGVEPYDIAAICPAAAEVVRREIAAEEARYAAEEARNRKVCEEERHRPRREPVLVAHDMILTDYGVIESFEDELPDDAFALLDKAQKNGLVAAAEGHIMIRTHSDYENCVTAEVYRRRPPLEVKGWDHVVEVGYASPTGSIRLGDAMSGPSMPNLAFRGEGRYRIRVHYREPGWDAWTPQHLLIQVFPGEGHRVVEHRRPS